MPSLLKPLAKDKNKTHLLHAILFPKSKFSINDAMNWLNQNNLKFVHNRDTTNFHRFRIRETIYGWLFYTKTLNDGVEMIYMYKPLYYPIISDKPNKKFFIFTPEGGKKIYFGDSKYEHYTEGHLDKRRKELYNIRHKKNEDFNNPNTAGFWSYHFLWEYPTYKQAYKNIVSLLQ